MLNQVVIVGRLTKDPEVIETDSGKKLSTITMAVPRPYKNEEGVYETDFINCTLFQGVAVNTSEYCKKGDIIGVKGRVATNSYEDKNTGEKKFSLDIIAEKVTYLSSKSPERTNDNRDDR